MRTDNHGKLIPECLGCSWWRDSDKILVFLRPLICQYWCEECWTIYVEAHRNKKGHVSVLRDWFEEPKDGESMVYNPDTGETVKWEPTPLFMYCPKCWPTPVPVSTATPDGKPVRYSGGILGWVHEAKTFFCPFCHPNESRMTFAQLWKRKCECLFWSGGKATNVRGYRYSELIQSELESMDARPPNGDSNNPRLRGRIA